MRRYTGGKRRDANEAELVAAFRRCGAMVLHLSGAGVPDMAVNLRGRTKLVEVKSRHGAETDAQRSSVFPRLTIRSLDDVMVAVREWHR